MTIEGAIAELQNLIKDDDVPFYYNGAIQKVIETIIDECKPKVREWIPCEERMPQEYGKYLTTIESLLEECSNGVDIIRYGKFTTPDDEEKVGWYFFDEWGEWEATHVIAWQPLLKPYEMERSE